MSGDQRYNALPSHAIVIQHTTVKVTGTGPISLQDVRAGNAHLHGNGSMIMCSIIAWCNLIIGY